MSTQSISESLCRINTWLRFSPLRAHTSHSPHSLCVPFSPLSRIGSVSLILLSTPLRIFKRLLHMQTSSSEMKTLKSLESSSMLAYCVFIIPFPTPCFFPENEVISSLLTRTAQDRIQYPRQRRHLILLPRGGTWGNWWQNAYSPSSIFVAKLCSRIHLSAI